MPTATPALPTLPKGNKDLTLVVATIGILVILFAPIPPALLDLAIIANFGLGLTIMLLTFYVAKPVEFSTFPSLLLVATLYRLSLNVAATRLILTGGDAGEVIGSIGAFAVRGNFVIGLVVFSILVVVQYVVVTSGAQRVSEVAARFTLDSMPGQQMSIDADLNMGLIDRDEAVARRKGLEKEASFYGAMDGASKFVKGDAIAGIIILLINIIAGWIVGVTQMDMPWSEALQHFTLLTIGDGIATQLPALIISIATGIIVTRSASDRELSTEVFRQLGSVPRIPVIVAIVLLALLLLPGMPKWPIVVIALLAGSAWWRIRRARRQAVGTPLDEEVAADTGNMPPIEIRLGSRLSATWTGDAALLMDRIAGLRRVQEDQFGIAFPAVRLEDGEGLGDDQYEIRLFGARHGAADIHPDRVLAVPANGQRPALDGIETVDPAFGLPAWWIAPAAADAARASGCTIIDPLTVLTTHFGEIVRGEVATLLTRATVVALLDGVRKRQPGLVEELVPQILSVSDIQRVLQNLLSEGVSIANLDLIVEHLVDLARTQKDPIELTEAVRQRLAYAICHKLRGRHADLAVLSLDPRLENQLSANLGSAGGGTAMAFDPRLAEQLLRKLVPLTEAMFREGRAPVLLCGAELRRHLRTLTRRSLPNLSILSVGEIPMRITLKSFDIVRLEPQG
ncbi:flagellar biosynthesis protein FlhA [Sphingomonas sp. Leaf407]|uniref:flagellar biosynthesis protein FlhA n=1 Tax=unclassified Sphingomonas TaxID=196159 RepID=UPI0006F4792D|nr:MULTISPECIES: flagellar biosynthesis protein FlhA [unclassified Sphingomonas]KQN39509.1 flagellar biosynthesis protein FlhA [Sphingomonas sp. Leaf42]KQT28786.1 flagellar biosynthesis protein FlhA [Sphingomonas sp. Leaf407]